MQAQRYRLRFVSGVSWPGATYGSSTYGGPITYGQRATDPVSAYRYRLVPLPAGGPTRPAWMRRTCDLAPPLQAQILSESGPLDLTAFSEGYFVLTPIDGRDIYPYLLPATVDDVTNGIVSHAWVDQPPYVAAGVYRVVLAIQMTSTRRLALPADDNSYFHVLPVEALLHA